MPPRHRTATRVALLLAGAAVVFGGCTGKRSTGGQTGGSGAGGVGSAPPGGAGAAGTLVPVPVPPAQLPQGTAGPINPGRVTAHRLNKVEYDNTIRDLVGLDLKPSSTFGFPDDTYIEGFDNNADALSASPLLLEQYEAAAAAVVKAALDPTNAAARARIVTCDPTKAGEGPCATQILSGFAARAWRRPVVAAGITRPTRRSSRSRDRSATASRTASPRRCRPCCSRRSSSSASRRTRAPARWPPCPTTSSPRASRTSSGAACPTTSCWRARPPARCTHPTSWRGRSRACSRTRRAPRSSRTSPASGSAAASSPWSRSRSPT